VQKLFEGFKNSGVMSVRSPELKDLDRISQYDPDAADSLRRETDELPPAYAENRKRSIEHGLDAIAVRSISL
jgi:hypothetical protein